VYTNCHIFLNYERADFKQPNLDSQFLRLTLHLAKLDFYTSSQNVIYTLKILCA